MVKQIKIAISGKANAGKNSVAEILVDQLKFPNSKSKITAIADPMKHIVIDIFPEAKSEWLYGESKLRSEIIHEKYRDANNNPLTYRQALLDLGRLGRSYNKDIWLNLLVEEADNNDSISTYVVADVRFRSEFDYLKSNNFYMVRVIRKQNAQINDISELEQDTIRNDEFDWIIENNGTLDKLKFDVECFTDEIKAHDCDVGIVSPYFHCPKCRK